MKLSTKGRYGVRAMLDLALHDAHGPTSLSSIARRQNISLNYLEQIISILKKANLVESVRGAQGGYILTCKPDEITVGDILRILEGSLAPVSCVDRESNQALCGQAGNCATRNVWSSLRDSINHALDAISLQQLAKDQKNLINSWE